MRGFVTLTFLVALLGLGAAAASNTTPPDNKGLEFVVMFMENMKLGSQIFPLELYITTAEKKDVHVHVTSPKWSSPKIDKTFTIKDGDVEKVLIDPIFRMNGSDVSSKALLITADAEVACYGANKETLSNDVYLGLPVDALGTEYYAMTYSPATLKSEVGLAGTEDGTNVIVTLPKDNGAVDVNFQGKTYHAGDKINVKLDKYDTLQIQSKGDLTGTHIETDKPVSAFSGNIKTTVSKGNFSDHLVEQLVPTDRWGEQFVTAPIPGRTVGDVFRIIAKEDNTVVTIPGLPKMTLKKGETGTFELPSNKYNSVTSTKPIMLAQFVKTQQKGTEPADPSMMILPPYEQFGSDYTFTTPEYSHPEYGPTFRYQNEFMVVAKKSDIGGLLLDGKPFPQTTWTDIPGTSLVGAYITLPHGAHTVRHSDPLSTFGGYLYGHAFHESYGFPTGMRTAIIYDPNCKPTVSVPGDGIDNDCDNKIDEELCTPDNHNKDDDGDGKFDEDCVKTTPIDGLWGKWGSWGTACSVTCGDGVRMRTRMCDSPAPKFGGKNCTGTDTKTKTCYGGTPCGLDIVAICLANKTSVVPNPMNCAQYFDCKRKSPFGKLHLFECPYPQLFSDVTMKCEDFDKVNCGRRHEPMAPCEYDQNKCNGSDPTCKPCLQRLASCVGVNDGRQGIAVFSPEYKDCKSNRTMGQGKCDMGYFNAGAHKCMPHNPGTLSFYCRQHPTALMAVPNNCAKFYNCAKAGRTMAAKTDECHYPDLFSTVTGKCENFTTVKCTTRKEPEAPCEYDQNICPASNTSCKPCPQVHANCIGQPDGMQPFPGRRWGPDFAECLLNRTMSQGKCTKGYFHPVTKKCTETVKPNEITDVCKANPRMKFPDPTNCAKFIDCSASNSALGNHVMECQYPDLFSTASMACETFENVTCTDRMEPMAPCQYDQHICNKGNSSCIKCPERLPSCIGLPDGDHAFPTRMWKPDYVTCYKNRTILPTKKCPKGYFHPVQEKCTEDVTRPDSKSYCQANPNDVIPLDDNCAQFINCTMVSMGMPSDPVQECKYPDLFSTMSMTCQDFTTVKCDKRMEPQAPCEYIQNCNKTDPSCSQCPNQLPSCVGLSDGDHAFPTRMWKPDYITCYKNRTIIPTKKCTKGYFHPTLEKCTEDVSRPDSKLYCQANPGSIVPMANNCAQFINCSQATMIGSSTPVQECNYPDLFSTMSMTCQDFTTVTCDKRMEPQAPCEYKQNCNKTDPSCTQCPNQLPSCVGLGDGNHAFPTRMWKPDYITCFKNRTILPTKKCTKGYFHPVLEQCTEDVKRPDAKPFCQANPNAVVPTADNCAQFINCTLASMGVSSDPIQECKYPDLFSPLSMTCQQFTTVTCDKRMEPQAPCEYIQNCNKTDPLCTLCPDQLPSCVGLSDGNHTFPTRMWKPDYITCYQNRTIIPTKKCTKGYFHPVQEKCTEDVTRPDAKPFCQANPNAVVPTADNCAQFINCTLASMGVSSDPIQECKYPDLFSTLSMTCQQFTTVTCDKRVEPQAPCEYIQNCNKTDPSCTLCPDQLPSCVGLSDGNHAFPTRMWKPDYITCYKNRTIIPTKKCTKGYFHPVQEKCTEDVMRPDAQSYCQANPNDVLPVMDDCAQFINCTAITTGGTSLAGPILECKYPDLFSTLSMTCQDFTTVNCDKRTEPQAPCEYMQNCKNTGMSCPLCPDHLPSCVGLSDGNHVFPSRMWKPDYITCYKNRTILPTKSCPDGYFHPVTEVCTKDVKRTDSKPYCQANPNDIVPLPSNCAQFINCTLVTMVTSADPVQECHYPDLFSKMSMSCQDFTTVTCNKRSEPQAPCEYDQNLCSTLMTSGCKPCQQRLPTCVGKQDGDHPFPARLWSGTFIHCFKNRTMAIDHCPTGAVFDPNARICTTKINTGDIDEFCKANPRSIKVNPVNCAQYYNCSDMATSLGHHLTECRYPYLYSVTSKQCENFETVQCTNRTEPQAPCEYMQNLCNQSDPSCKRCPSRLPSCVGLTDGDHAFPSRMWKPDYVTCYKNRTVSIKKCQTGYFHPNQEVCTTEVKRPDAKPYCQANPSDVAALMDDCAQYINCSVMFTGHVYRMAYGNPSDPVQECKYPDLFSISTMTCQDFTTVKCSTRKEPKAPCEYYQNICPSNTTACIVCSDRLPSCVGLTDGTHVFPGKLWKPDYITCYKNRTMLPLDRCKTGFYHPTTKQCTKDVTKVDAKPYCQANPKDIVPMYDNCAHFINCSALLTDPLSNAVQECKYPDLFSSSSLSCKPFTTVKCDKRMEPQAPCEYDQNVCLASNVNCVICPRRLPSCIGQPDGARPFPNRLWTSDFIQCYKNRTVAITKCAMGTIFDPNTLACISTVPTSKMDNFCLSNPTAIKTNPDNCAQYYNCSDNGAVLGHHLEECKYPQLFSDVTHRCEQFESVRCNHRMEPKAPCEYMQNMCKVNGSSCTPCPDRLPSCVGLKDGNHAFPTRTWKPDYITCYKNRTVSVNRCSNGYFHPKLELCTTFVINTDAKKYCQANPADIIPTTTNCAKYIDCVAYTSGALADPIHECHYPDLFSTKSMSCQDFTTVQCDTRLEPQAPCEYDQNKCDPNDLACMACPDRLPSCIGLNDGNHAFPSRLWKPDYITCYKNRTLLPINRCKVGFFHPIQGVCVEVVTKTDANSYCQANPRDVLPSPTNCAESINCTRSLLGFADVVQECRYPDLFSTLSMTCQDFTTVHCNKRQEPQAPCEYNQNICPANNPSCRPCPERLPSCVGVADGDQMAMGYRWTDTYVRCYRNRTLSVQHCPNGAVFDPNRRVCVSKINPGDIDSFCKANPGAVKAHDTNCAQFYNCSEPKSVLTSYVHECRYPDLFSTVTLRCEQFETVPCGTRHEPQPPCEYLRNRCNGTDPQCRPCQERLPSCVGLPDGTNAVPNHEWQAGFIQCYKNRTIAVNRCQSGYFHPSQKICTDVVQRVDAKEFCSHNPTAIVVTEDDCAQYFNCSLSSQTTGDVVAECKYPDLFSRNAMACGAFSRVSCDTRPEPQAPCEYVQNLCPRPDQTCIACPERLPSCRGLPNGAQPHPNHLWSDIYIECNTNRTMSVTKCIKGYFHPRLQECRSYVDPVDVPDYCSVHTTEVITSPGSCAVYYNCSTSKNGHVTECKYPDLYDTTVQGCAPFATVDCQKRPEPMAPCQYQQNICAMGDPACKPCQDRLPSCVGLTDGNHYFPGHPWQPDYITCYKNRTITVTSCNTGFFHPQLNVCVTRIATVDIPGFCSAHPNSIIPNPDNCAQYVNCSESTSTTVFMKECTYPDLFSSDTLMCTRFTRVDCDTRMEPQAPCEYSQNVCAAGDMNCSPCPERLPSCIGTPDGARAFTGREWTDNYIECFKNRTMALYKCPVGSVFDPMQASCVSKIDKTDIQSFCQFNKQAIKEHPDNCAQYFDCSKPTSPLGPYLMECDYPKLFSAQQMACVYFGSAQCGRKTEPQSPCEYLRNLCTPQDHSCTPCQDRLPSCIGLPDGQNAVHGRLWESDYVTCSKNRTMTVSQCQNGYFHPTQRACVTTLTKVDIVSYCQIHVQDVVADPRSCSRYFNCSDPSSPYGTYQAECRYPYLYSTYLKACVQFENTDCQNRPVPHTPCEYVQNICSPTDPQCTPCSQRYPSCYGKPDGNNPYPGSLWKADYIVCYKNRTLSVNKCGQGLFNPLTKVCEVAVTSVHIIPYCQSNPLDILPNPNTCSQYFDCSHVMATFGKIDECRYPDLFSMATRKCEPFQTVTCANRPEPQSPCDYDQNKCPINDPSCSPCQARLPSCVGLSDGNHVFGIQQWSPDYIECLTNRTVAVRQCPAGSFFSPHERKCTYNINTVDIVNFCRANPTVVRPHPTNCAQYYDCSSYILGSGHVKECSYPDLYDSTSMTCKKFTDVQCGIRYEPKTPCDYMDNQCPLTASSCQPCPQRLPSCVGLSNGNHPFPGMAWHQQYIVCYLNRTTTILRCPGTTVFNPNTRQCIDIIYITKYEILDYCKAYPNAVVADPDDCSRYFNCKGVNFAGTNSFQCTYPDLFSTIDRRCVNFNLVQCKSRKEPTSPCQYDHNICASSNGACIPCQIRLPDCTGLPDGNNGIPGMLWSVNYVKCYTNRTLEVKRCNKGIFDPNSRTCNEAVGPQHLQDVCTANPKAVVPHPTNCAQYFDCSKPSTPFGHFLVECHYPMLFDSTSLMCKQFMDVQCGTKFEPKSPCNYFENICPTGNLTCKPCQERLPSCVGLPDGMNAISSQSWSPYFITCSNGRTLTTDRCKVGFFDPRRRVCVISVQTVDVPQFCKSNPQTVLPDPSDCGRYFNCSSPINNYSHECKYPQLFSDKTSICDDFRSVFCGQRPQPQTPCEYSQNQCATGDVNCVPCQERLPSCKGLPDGVNGVTNRLWTNMYIQCLLNRTIIVQYCADGIFDPVRKACVKYIDPGRVSDVCRANPSAMFPDPTNCAKYYDCRSASRSFVVQYQKECNYPNLYSTATHSCQKYDTVTCGSRHEPMSPCEYSQNQCHSTANCQPCPERLPSCVGLPNGDNAFQGQLWSGNYVVCSYNRTVLIKQCLNNFMFDPVLRTCVRYVDPARVVDYCKWNPTAVLPSVNNAAQYYDCSQPSTPLHVPYLLECNYPDLFGDLLLRCKDFTTVPTDKRPVPQAPCQYQKNRCKVTDMGCTPCPQRLYSCIGLPDGHNAIEGKHWVPEYVDCYLNRTLGTGKCDQGVFDPMKRQCVVPTTPGPVSIADQCRMNPAQMIPHPGSCSLYYNCSKAVPTFGSLMPVQLQECKYPELYSTVFRRCLDFQFVRCDHRNEVMAPCQYLQNQCDPSDVTCIACPQRLPSCIGLPDGDNAVIGRYWSREYIHCFKNRTLSVSRCQTGFFHPFTKSCTDVVDKVDVDEYCTANPTAIIPSADNCAQYHDCSQHSRLQVHVTGGSSNQECHYPDLFSTITNKCEPFTKVYCQKRKEPQAPCEYSQNLCSSSDPSCAPCDTRLPSCVGLANGNIAIPGREYTDTYIECYLNRTLAVKKCSTGFFDAGLRICVLKINSANVGPYCQRNKFAILPHPTNCAWYYDCSITGRTLQSVYPFDIKYVQECPYPQLFSSASMRCEYFPSVSCNGHFEPQAPCEYYKNRCDPTQQGCVPCPSRLPSCKSLRDGQHVITNLNDGLDYLVTCSVNRTLAYEVCKPGMPMCQMTTLPAVVTTSVTVPSTAPTTIPTTASTTVPTTVSTQTTRPIIIIPETTTKPVLGICDINKGRMVPNPLHCGQYYDCTRATEPYLYECQYPQMFSDVNYRCQDFQTVKCNGRPEYKTPCEYQLNVCSYNDPFCAPCPERLPSCSNLADGNHAFPGRLGTSSYITCLLGRTVFIGTCPTGTFDTILKQCSVQQVTTIKPTDKPDTVESYCKSHPNDVLPHPTNCAQFYDCNDIYTVNMVPVKECQYPLLFHPIIRGCADYSIVRCENRYEPQAPCDYYANQCHGGGCIPCPNRFVSCVGLSDGNHVYPGMEMTSTYVRCNRNRTIAVETCSSGIFDPTTRQCRSKIQTTMQPLDSLTAFCRLYPNGVLTDPDNCAQYFTCNNEQTRLGHYRMECPYPLLFNDVTKLCSGRASVRCEQRTEPKTSCEYQLYQCIGVDCHRCLVPGATLPTNPPTSALPTLPAVHTLPPVVTQPPQIFTNPPIVQTQPPTGPTCTGKPNGLNPYPGRELTGHYIVCENNRLIEIGICIVNKILDPFRHVCTDPANPAIIDAYCQANPGVTIPSVTNCAQFYKCGNDVMGRRHNLQECTYPQLFSTIDNTCKDFTDVQCGQRTEPVTPCEYKQNQCDPLDYSCTPCEERKPSCTGRPDGPNPFPNSPLSANYIICDHGRTIEILKCSAGIFDPASHGCKIQDKFTEFCRLHPNGVMTDQEHCAQFFTCNNENTPLGHFRMECPYPQLFDDVTKLCRDRGPWVRCGQRPEPKTSCEYKLYKCIGVDCQRCLVPGEHITTNPPVMTFAPQTLPAVVTQPPKIFTNPPIVQTQPPQGPTCTGKPNGLNPYPGRELTGHYIVCENNRLIEIGICIVNKILDPFRHVCTDPADPAIIDAYCQVNPGVTIPSVTNCAQFYKCGNDVMGRRHDLKECTYPQLFSTIDNTCKDFTAVQCGQRVEPISPCEYRQNQCATSDPNCTPCEERKPSCAGRPDGSNPFPNTPLSADYIICDHGRTMEILKCSDGLFDPVSLKCISSKPDPLSEFCRLNPNGVMIDPDHCAQYFTCNNENTPLGHFRMECPYPQLFDDVTKLCRDRGPWVRCGLRVEPKTSCEYKLYRCIGVDCMRCLVPGQTVPTYPAAMTTAPPAVRTQPPIVTQPPQIFTNPPIVQTQPPQGPTCTGKPNGLNPYPGRELTGHYIVCENNQLIEIGICIVNKILDPFRHACKDPADPAIIDAYCQANPGVTIPSVTNCAQFYKCGNDVMGRRHDLKECTYPQLFSTIDNTCKDFTAVQCGQRVEPISPCEYSQNQCATSDASCTPCEERKPSCVGRSDGPNPFPNTPMSVNYIICDHGRTMEILKCSAGLFDPVSLECKSSKPDALSEFCRLHPNGVMTDPDHCAQYFTCNNENTPLGHFRMECPYPQLFDDVTKLCRDRGPWVRCGQRAEPKTSCKYKLYRCIGVDCMRCLVPGAPVTTYPAVITAAPPAVYTLPPVVTQPPQIFTNPPIVQTQPSTGPTCTGKPNGLNPYPGRELTGHYIVCENNRLIEIGICIVNKILDPFRRVCTDPADAAIIDAYCSANPGVTIPSVTNCAQFYECGSDVNDHHHELQECIYPQLFSTVDNTCKSFTDVQCGQRVEPVTPCEYHQYQCDHSDPSCVPCQQRMPSCIGRQNGPNPYPNAPMSSDYIVCDSGRTVEITKCRLGYFDPMSMECKSIVRGIKIY